jgi:thioredoxin 1
MANVTEFTDANFQQEVLEAEHPVLVDFWAPWCGPCRQITPMIEALSAAYSGKAKIGKLNIDDSPGVAQQYSVFNIPTLILFKAGQDVERFVGIQPQAKIAQALDSHVG